MPPRITPAEPPYDAWAQETFDRVMPPGAEPLLLFLFERSGIRTGVDLDAAIAANKWFETVLGRPLPSSVGKAGGFAAR